jgi:hypothetical protein
MAAWVGDFPLIEPSPAFLQHVCARVEHLPHRSWPLFFRRLFAALPLQAAAAVVVVVSAALVWQMTPGLWRGEVAEVEPPARIEPRMSHERGVSPFPELLPFEPMLDESFPTPVPLVQALPRWPAAGSREVFVRVGHELSAMPLLARPPTPGRISEVVFSPSLTLRATDPVQAAQQIWELVPTTGGELLQSQGMVTPADRTSHGIVRLTLAITADRYQALLEAIHQLPGTAVTEERMASVGRDVLQWSPGHLRRVVHAQPAKAALMTLIITILPR